MNGRTIAVLLAIILIANLAALSIFLIRQHDLMAARPAEALKQDGATLVAVPIGDKVVYVPEGTEVEIEYQEVDEHNQVIKSVTETASGKGAGYQGSGSDMTSKIKSEAPQVELAHGTGAKGGKSTFDLTALGGINTTSILAAVGALAIVGGIGLAFTGRYGLGLGIAAGGAVVIVAGFTFEKYPWIIAIAGAIGLLMVGIMIWKAWKGRQREVEHEKDKVAMSAIVSGIDKSGTEGAAVREKIKEAAKNMGQDQVVRKQVAKRKAEAGISNTDGAVCTKVNV